MDWWRYGPPWSAGARGNRLADRLNRDPNDRAGTRRLARRLSSPRANIRSEGAWILQELVDPSPANRALVALHLYDADHGARFWCVNAAELYPDRYDTATLERSVQVIEGLAATGQFRVGGRALYEEKTSDLLKALANRERSPEMFRAAVLSPPQLQLIYGALSWTNENLYFDADKDQRILEYVGATASFLQKVEGELLWPIVTASRRTGTCETTVGEIIDLFGRSDANATIGANRRLLLTCLGILDAKLADSDLATIHETSRHDLLALITLVSEA